MNRIRDEVSLGKAGMVTTAEGWGYRTFSRPDDGDLGYGRVLVAICKGPAQRRFDPERLRFRLRGPEGHVRWRTASWLVPVEESGSICPGSVALTDRRDTQVEFFSFGGTVDSITRSEVLVHVFMSPTPILELTGPIESVSDQRVYEAGGILAALGER